MLIDTLVFIVALFLRVMLFFRSVLSAWKKLVVYTSLYVFLLSDLNVISLIVLLSSAPLCVDVLGIYGAWREG